MESLACSVGGETICVMPKENEVFIDEVKRLLTTIDALAR